MQLLRQGEISITVAWWMRGDRKRFVVRVDQKLTAFVELESTIRAHGQLNMHREARSR